MANPEHLEILKQGVEAWNEWRRENPKTSPDLARPNLIEADFRELDLSGANLSNADLVSAELFGADLRGADLRGANLGDADLRRASLIGARLIGADLTDANLTRADLGEANLDGADLSRASLIGAKLSRASLIGAKLSNANLVSAELFGADLRGADLRRAHLGGADLRRAKLGDTNFSNTGLNHADLTDALLFSTRFADTDLSLTKGLESVVHDGPSSIGIDTLYDSGGSIPEVFLRGCGVPDTFIAFARSLVVTAIDFYSCFISYSSKNQPFAEHLYSDLQSKGVRCWFAPEDLKIGEKIRGRIDESIRVHDKLLLVLSKYSVESEWVEKEVETAMEQERKQKRTVLFPVMLDNSVMKIESGWPADIRRSRNIGDFRKWKDHDAYQKAFNRLLRDLKAEAVKE